MKKILLGLLGLIIIAVGILFGVNGTSNYDSTKYSLTLSPKNTPFGVGSNISYILPDQFDKAHKLSTTTQKLIFAFSKDMGHEVKAFMDGKPASFLKEKHAVILLDVSPMPTVILNTFALPDLKKSSYSTLLIYDKEMAKQLKEGLKADQIAVLTLNGGKITKISYASTEAALNKLL